MVGSPMISYQRSIGTWLVTMIERASYRSSTISSRSRRCSAVSASGPQSSRMSRSTRAIWRRVLGVAPVGTCQCQGLEQAGHAMVGNGEILLQAFCPSAQASQLLPTPQGPVISRLCRARIQSQPASLRNSAGRGRAWPGKRRPRRWRSGATWRRGHGFRTSYAGAMSLPVRAGAPAIRHGRGWRPRAGRAEVGEAFGHAVQAKRVQQIEGRMGEHVNVLQWK
jgi:hypothetical protein